MNHLVFLDPHASELEKILSGVKSMLIKEFASGQPGSYAIDPGDNLYFLRNKDECVVRVKATVVRVLSATGGSGEDLSHILKEMQPKLQLTEDQYNYWSARKQVLLVEFASAQKIGAIHVEPRQIMDKNGWTAFAEFSLIS
jgi:hypothetical protein